MSQLLDLRQGVIGGIKTALSKTDVQGHLGRFTEAELQRFILAAPAVRVAILALEKGAPTPDQGVDYCARVGIYVVTNDRPGLPRDEAAAVAVEIILKLCDRTDWGLRKRGVRLSESAAAQNLYTDKGLGAGAALWAIDLRQPIRLTDEIADQAALKRLFVGAAPKVGSGHEPDYSEVTPQALPADDV